MKYAIIILFMVFSIMGLQAFRQTRTDFNEWAVNYVASLHVQPKAMPQQLDVNAFYPVSMPQIKDIN